MKIINCSCVSMKTLDYSCVIMKLPDCSHVHDQVVNDFEGLGFELG